MNVVINNYGFQPFDVMEDCFSEKEQLKELTKFKKEYLKTPWNNTRGFSLIYYAVCFIFFLVHFGTLFLNHKKVSFFVLDT